MSTGIITVISVAVILAGALMNAAIAAKRRRRLQQLFDPKYERLAGERDIKLVVNSALVGRKSRACGPGMAGTRGASVANDPATNQAGSAAGPAVGWTT